MKSICRCWWQSPCCLYSSHKTTCLISSFHLKIVSVWGSRFEHYLLLSFLWLWRNTLRQSNSDTKEGPISSSFHHFRSEGRNSSMGLKHRLWRSAVCYLIGWLLPATLLIHPRIAWSRNSTAHSGLSPSTSINNQHNPLPTQRCVPRPFNVGNWGKSLKLRIPSQIALGCVKLTVKANLDIVTVLPCLTYL